MLKFLPILLAVLALISGIFYFQRRETLKKKMDELLQKSKLQMTNKLPEPTPVFRVNDNSDLEGKFPTETPTPTATPIPTVDEESPDENKTKGGLTASTKTKTKTVTVCTPVYGMANSCAEHVVVDTGLDSNAFFNLAGLSYLGGLLAFVKSKRTRGA